MNTLHIQTDSATLITDLIFISLFAVSHNGLSLGSTPVVSPILELVCLHSRCVWSVCVCVSLHMIILFMLWDGAEKRAALLEPAGRIDWIHCNLL